MEAAQKLCGLCASATWGLLRAVAVAVAGSYQGAHAVCGLGFRVDSEHKSVTSSHEYCSPAWLLKCMQECCGPA